jgi:multidrug efflux pump
VLYALGLTVNIVVLFSLILAVGMLVDGAIVVVELADRKMAEGLSKQEAYAIASKRMSWPIISSTATTLAAFAPLLFWPGIPGEFMKYMPITMICVLSSSLLMALIFVPTMGAIIGKAGAAGDPKMRKSLAAAEDGNLDDIISPFSDAPLRARFSSLYWPSLPSSVYRLLTASSVKALNSFRKRSRNSPPSSSMHAVIYQSMSRICWSRKSKNT